MTTDTQVRERGELQDTLTKARRALRHTVHDLTDEQAAERSTVSSLCLGGLIKHVTRVEGQWATFIVDGASAIPPGDDPAVQAEHAAAFRMGPGEKLGDILRSYEVVAGRTDELIRTLPDLGAESPLPEAPWFEPGTRWSARRVLLHIVAETAQHAGHADILRESIDGATSTK